jgi:hypothetical protein
MPGTRARCNELGTQRDAEDVEAVAVAVDVIVEQTHVPDPPTCTFLPFRRPTSAHPGRRSMASRRSTRKCAPS